MLDIKQIQAIYGIEFQDLADMFGYKTRKSYMQTTKRKKIEGAIEKLHNIFMNGVPTKKTVASDTPTTDSIK